VPPSNTPEPGDWENFDLRRFVLDTVRSIEYAAAESGLLEDRVARIEEAIAAPWWRRWLLWRRLRREIRASAATWPEEYIPRNDFLGRRFEWAAFTVSERYDRQAWQPRFDSAGQDGQDPVEGGGDDSADPGEGFLP
jgi:hypothetical protein